MELREYAQYDGLGLAELVRTGQVSAAELAETGLRAIAAMNPVLNAVIESYDDAPAGASSEGPFGGVPFLLKDIGSHDSDVLFELGSRLTQGLRAPPFASELVNRFKAAGVTVLGRTNIPELGSSCTTEPLLYGPTRNPWNVERTPGGSSGGAAAAVASGMVPIAHANDAGGSIRWPASACGLVGLKPSRNLNPHGPDEGLAVNGLACEHIVSRTVRDTAAMLDATAGPDSGAWCYTAPISGSYLQEAQVAPKPLRIALDLNARFPPARLQPEVLAAMQDTVRLLESLGHHVEEASPEFDHDALLESFAILWSTDLRTGILQLAEITGRPIDDTTLEPHLLAAYRDSAAVSGVRFNAALKDMNKISRAFGQMFGKYDVILTPTGAQEPFPLGKVPAIPADRFFDWFLEMCAHCPFTGAVNIAGIPAISLPLGWSPSGLPVGSHFIGPIGGELRLLQLANQLEAAQPWAGKLPGHHVSTL